MQVNSTSSGTPHEQSAVAAPASIREATVLDVESLVPLFDEYRKFYRQASDLSGARQFLLDRFRYNQSSIFIAFRNDNPVGFTQLYPSFSSGAMAQILTLNDLFVIPEARSVGVGSALLRRAAEYAQQIGALRLTLSTEVNNTSAQTLYEELGWKRDHVFCVYSLAL